MVYDILNETLSNTLKKNQSLSKEVMTLLTDDLKKALHLNTTSNTSMR
ncbi:MAG: hypothetical protein AB8U25_06540 [Rickettsiales endosymbiont of Dermacentor nuttalli]